jgi:hypothetical protein
VERDPDVFAVGEREALRHHADDRRRRAVEAHHPADDVARAAEVALPEAVRDDDDAIGAGAVVRGAEVAAERRPDAQDAEEVRRRPGALVAPRLAVHGHVDRLAAAIRRHHREGALRLGKLDEVHRRHPPVGVEAASGRRVDEIHVNEPVRVRERESAEQHAVDDGELRGDAADAEGEHQDGQGAERAFLQEDAHADADVAENVLEHAQNPGDGDTNSG